MKEDANIIRRVAEAKADVKAADRMIADYMPFIKSETAKLTGSVPREGEDDELSIAMMAFHEAIEGYSRSRGAFLSFAALVIKRRLIDYGRREKRFSGHVSLSSPVTEDENVPLEDTIESENDEYEALHEREALRHEIAELTAQLAEFDITLTDVAKNCPKQERTQRACRELLIFAMKNPELIRKLRESGRLPVADLQKGSGVERKTIDRHRKYIVTLLLIYSNGYECIRDHLKEIFGAGEGGERA